MILKKTTYENTPRIRKESTDIGHLAKLLESDEKSHQRIALKLLEGGLYYEIQSTDSGLYTKVKELSVLQTPRGLKLAQTDVILDGTVADGDYRGRAYKVSVPEVLDYVSGSLMMATVFTGEDLSLYFEFSDSINWDKLEMLKDKF